MIIKHRKPSVHGNAIDLNVRESTYWKWDHYVTMHFEYRPDLLLLGKQIPVAEEAHSER